MNDKFKQYIEEEFMVALIAEFINQSNNGTLDTSNYNDDSFELLMEINTILKDYQKRFFK